MQSTAYIMKASAKPRGMSLSMPQFDSKKEKKEDDVPMLIDEVFGDLENMFYLLRYRIFRSLVWSVSFFFHVACFAVIWCIWL